VLLVDDSYAQLYDKITAAVRRVSDQPIKYVINSHIHGDHHGGNEAMVKAGVTVIAHENVRSRMATGGRDAFSNQPIPPAVPGALPIVTYRDAMTIYFNGETIDLIHAPPSHTDSDTIVYFRNANVIFVGGIYGNNLNYPFIDIGMGGSLAGVIAAEEMILPMIDDNTKIFADQGSGETQGLDAGVARHAGHRPRSRAAADQRWQERGRDGCRQADTGFRPDLGEAGQLLHRRNHDPPGVPVAQERPVRGPATIGPVAGRRWPVALLTQQVDAQVADEQEGVQELERRHSAAVVPAGQDRHIVRESSVLRTRAPGSAIGRPGT
jgi:glyoxylase-like metal-dependent hydrolase (beta-lactamase superfamily II)